MSTSATKTQDPLAPLNGLVTRILALLVLMVIVGLPLTLFAGGSMFDLGDGRACVHTAADNLALDVDRPEVFEHLYGPKDGASIQAETAQLCISEPSLGIDLVAAGANNLSGLVVGIGSLVMLWRLIRTARAQGLFSAAVARGTRRVGRYLLLSSLVMMVITSLLEGVVRAHALIDEAWSDQAFRWAFPFTEVIVAAGLITLGRVFGRAVVLQEEQDATI